MKPKNVIGIVAAILFASLWALPLSRATSFVRVARDYSNETGSLDASNDLLFGTSLLASYSISVVVGFAVAWLLSRRPHIAFVLPVGLIVFAAVEVLRLEPEAPIHLFASMTPWRPAWFSIAAVAVAVGLNATLPRNSIFDKARGHG